MSTRPAARGCARSVTAGHLRHCVPAAYGGARETLDSRALCVARETLAYADGLADFAFAMQGLGSGPITLAGSEAQRAHWLPKVARGEAIAAFALSEPDAGSDALALATRATRDGDGWRLDGCKTWISNGGIADFYCVFARTGDARARRASRRSSFRRTRPGLTVAERIDVIAPHPLARLVFDGCRVPADAMLGAQGEGFKLAMRTLDIFRASVAAAATGFARRALDEATRAREGPPDVRQHARRAAARAGDARRDGGSRSTPRRCSPRARRGSATCSRRAHDARGGDREDGRDRVGATGDRRGAAAPRRARAARRRGRRAAVPRDPRAAHLRRRDRGPEADRRSRSTEVCPDRSTSKAAMQTWVTSAPSAHVDTFARDNLPPREHGRSSSSIGRSSTIPTG